VLAGQGLIVDDASQLQLAKALAAAVHRASLKLAQYAEAKAAMSRMSPKGRLSCQINGLQSAHTI
jgi:hypothetical protein